jgi:hypothetical protein
MAGRVIKAVRSLDAVELPGAKRRTRAEKQLVNGIKALVRTKRNRSKDPQVSMSITQARRAGRQGRAAVGEGLRHVMSETVGGSAAVGCCRARDYLWGVDGMKKDENCEL